MNLIKIYLQRIGCLISVALAMIVVTALVKMATKSFGMDSASSQKVADTAGEWAGKGLFSGRGQSSHQWPGSVLAW